jgi:hypothetical protein
MFSATHGCNPQIILMQLGGCSISTVSRSIFAIPWEKKATADSIGQVWLRSQYAARLRFTPPSAPLNGARSLTIRSSFFTARAALPGPLLPGPPSAGGRRSAAPRCRAPRPRRPRPVRSPPAVHAPTLVERLRLSHASRARSAARSCTAPSAMREPRSGEQPAY